MALGLDPKAAPQLGGSHQVMIGGGDFNSRGGVFTKEYVQGRVRDLRTFTGGLSLLEWFVVLAIFGAAGYFIVNVALNLLT
jgi:hypothetical protein